MYTDIKSYQIVIALLKKYNIRNLVISPGNRHTPIVRSIEDDDFFTCYSIVDERSAAFFALGLIKELKEPVCICCTSGTSVSNYVSGVSEAFYGRLPLIVISSDRNPYYLYQKEEQMVPQTDIFKGIIKKEVTLPFVKDDKDFWYCQRLVNEALCDIEYCADGPVHINVPVEEGLFDFNTETLPEVTKINKIYSHDAEKWQEKADKLKKASRILVLYGQAGPIGKEEEKIIESFARKYGAVFATDHLSNLNCFGAVRVYNGISGFYSKMIQEFVPEIVISLNGNAVEIFEWLKNVSGQYEYWNIDKTGRISDPMRCLSDIFCCGEIEFFRKMNSYKAEDAAPTYYEKWVNHVNSVNLPQFAYSDIYAARELMRAIPENAILNLGNSNSVRFAQRFPLKAGVSVYCNRAVNGIDGSMSSFIGQSYVHNGLSFLLIGDLSFFYDMNALWSRYIKNNVRIMLNNNGCGEIFYTNARQNPETVGRHIAADNAVAAEGWAKSCGFTYLKATNKEEFDENIKQFVSADSDKPILFEVMTDKYENIKEISKIAGASIDKSPVNMAKKAVKKVLNNIIKR